MKYIHTSGKDEIFKLRAQATEEVKKVKTNKIQTHTGMNTVDLIL